ncbi:MAG: AAA-like domain-containing protein [Scytonematopsis contorta HA4267-MV1]|jgi:diguanylate cyclase (GGDEF)-like protein|nr:AAA-like domain-containing protein [Scytonematopsis contorta HA4267-MV1]
MSTNQILEVVENLLKRKLAPLEQFILIQSWQGSGYQDMAQNSGYGRDYFKEVGSLLWKSISEAVGRRVTKKNLQLVLNQYCQDKSNSDSTVIFSQSNANVYTHKQTLFSSVETFVRYPGSPLAFDSPFYINRPPTENLVNAEIHQPGCLVRVKAPRRMGKSSLLNVVIAHAQSFGYKTVYLDFQEVDSTFFVSLDKFLRWFSANVSNKLLLVSKLNDYWDEDIGSKVSCKNYFERYLLEQIDSPLVLVFNELNRIFEYPNIAQDFLSMLRYWHETAQRVDTWQKLRIVMSHSTENYIELKINQFPFNVGFTVELPPFTLEQVQSLAQRYGLEWAASSDEMYRLEPLQAMVGGHPFLIALALYYLRKGKITLDVLLDEDAIYRVSTEIYSDYLRGLLNSLMAEPKLMSAMQQLVTSKTVELDAITAYKLESMGLVQLDACQASISCELYKFYFRQELEKQNLASALWYSFSGRLLNRLEQEQEPDVRLNHTDKLSKFVSLHYFNQYLQTEWQKWQVTVTPLHLVVCEIDYFKMYNDRKGIQAGNESLQNISNIVFNYLQYQAVIIAHYDAKFFAILPRNNSSNVLQLAETIRYEVEALQIDRTQLGWDGFPAPVLTVSLGVAITIPDAQHTSAMLMAAAEDALFLAKRKGHNCVNLYPVLELI